MIAPTVLARRMERYFVAKVLLVAIGECRRIGRQAKILALGERRIFKGGAG